MKTRGPIAHHLNIATACVATYTIVSAKQWLNETVKKPVTSKKNIFKIMQDWFDDHDYKDANF